MIVEMAHNLDNSQVCYKMKPNIMELKLDDEEESSKDMLHSAWMPKMKVWGRGGENDQLRGTGQKQIHEK